MNYTANGITALNLPFPQTPTLLLTPSPLLSNIHFWSTLSPVAPLSPATRRQGAHLFQVNTHTKPHTHRHSLITSRPSFKPTFPVWFQFPSVLTPQFQIPVHSMDGTNTPGPISPDPQKT